MSTHRYSIVFLAGHGIGPEVTAEASRAVAAATRLHGLGVDEQHVAFGTDALMRFGHPYPMSSRREVLGADAVLVGPGGEPLDPLESELDVRASVTRIRFDGNRELSVFAPVGADGWAWTLARAVAAARESRARLTLVGVDDEWADAAELEVARTGLEVQRLTGAEAMRELVRAPHAFDVLLAPPELAMAMSEVAACTSSRRLAAWGRLAESGPSVFGAGLEPQHEVAGHGVADPAPVLLAASLLLGEGLGERSAAATLAGALGRAGTAAPTPSTRGYADRVLAQLPLSLNVEFFPEAV